MKEKQRVFLMAMLFTMLPALAFVVNGASAKGNKPIVVGAPVPRASAYGQNGERGLIPR